LIQNSTGVVGFRIVFIEIILRQHNFIQKQPFRDPSAAAGMIDG
jgi:hypothetical protein